MFDASTSMSGIKIGVTATTISDASFFVFFNYNGLGSRNKDSGKIVTYCISQTLQPTFYRVQASATFKHSR